MRAQPVPDLVFRRIRVCASDWQTELRPCFGLVGGLIDEVTFIGVFLKAGLRDKNPATPGVFLKAGFRVRTPEMTGASYAQ